MSSCEAATDKGFQVLNQNTATIFHGEQMRILDFQGGYLMK